MPSSTTPNPYAATTWSTSPYDDVTMPSGQLAQVRKPGIQRLIGDGLLDSADTLSALVDQKHIKRVKGKPEVDGASLIKDPKNMLAVLDLVDKIVEHMIVQPTVKRPVMIDSVDETKNRPLLDNEREEDVVYTDAIDMGDRMFIFQYALGGSSDVERFRSGLNEAMGSMATK